MRITLQPRGEHTRLATYLSPLLAAALTLLVGAVLFAAVGNDPLATLHAFFIMPVSDVYGLSELGVKAAPILLCATGLAICYRANVWNIGAEGQFLLGGLIGSWAALTLLEAEGWWVLPLILLAGSAAGAGWAAIPALLKTRFNCNEILTTIMLNYIGLNLLLYAVHGPLKDPAGYNFPESALFSDSATLPILLDGTRVHLGVVLALVAVLLVWLLLSKTFLGFQLQVLGKDASAARFAGFRVNKLIWVALLMCGGLAGLAGVAEVTGPIGQLIPQISPGYGYAAIIVAFLGRQHPIGILLASLLMALLYMGGEMVQIEMGLPLALTGLFQGLLLFFLLACDVLIAYRIRIIKAKPLDASVSCVE